MYEPGTWVDRVSPTPLLMVVGLEDTITLTDLQLRAFETALEPKRLVMIPGDHFAPYITEFETASTAALAWFDTYLGEKASR